MVNIRLQRDTDSCFVLRDRMSEEESDGVSVRNELEVGIFGRVKEWCFVPAGHGLLRLSVGGGLDTVGRAGEGKSESEWNCLELHLEIARVFWLKWCAVEEDERDLDSLVVLHADLNRCESELMFADSKVGGL